MSNVRFTDTTDEGYVEQRFDEPSFMKKWTDDQKAEFAYQLLLCVPVSTLINVVDKLSPLLHKDFLSLLPFEIAIEIVLYLDITSLINMTRVSKKWKTLCEDTLLWRELFHLKGWKSNKESIQHYLSTDNNNNNINARLKPFYFDNKSYSSQLISTNKPTRVYPSRSHPSPSKEIVSHLIIERNRPNIKRHIKYDETAIFHYKENADKRYINWKRLYKNRNLIDKRWKEGKCKSSEFPSSSSIEHNGGGIYCLQFNQSILVTGSRDRNLKIWDIKSGELKFTLESHFGSVLCLQFNDKYLITGSSDSTLIIWNINTGKKIKSLIGHTESVLNVKFNIDNNCIVSCSKDRTVRIWNLELGTLEITLIGHRAAVNAVQFKDNIIISASGDRTIKKWDLNTGKCLQTLDSHSRGIACVEYDGQYIISGSSDQTIRVWNSITGECIHILEGHTDLVRTIQLNTKLNRIVSGSYDGTLKIWNLSDGKLLKSFNQSIHGRILNLQFDFGRVICCSNLGKIIMYDFTHGIDTQFLL